MRLAFVGDIALGDHPKTVGFGFRSRYPRGIPAELAGRLRPPGPPPDLLVGNLEFALGFDARSAASHATLQCRGLDAYAGFLARAGVGAVNVANNHMSQAGAGAFHHTVALMRRAGIHVVGTPDDFGARGVLTVGDCRIALLGWSDRPRQYASDLPPYNEFSDAAYEQVARARRRAPIVIASMHWGDEFILVPSERERVVARRLIESGATLVIGHHPHVVRPIERHGSGLIAYSLGNFVGDMTWDLRTRLSGWLVVETEEDRVADWSLRPAIIADDFLPRPAGAEEDEQLRRISRSTLREAREVARLGYARVAGRAHRRHVRRTAWMMLRNVRRYPRHVAAEAFGGALAHRLRRLLPRMLTAMPPRSLAP